MAAAAVALATQVLMFPEAPAKGPSLVDRLDDIKVILETLESLEDTEHSEGYREELQKELITAIAGTREKIDRTAAAFDALEASRAAAEAAMKRQKVRMERFARRVESLESYMLAVLTASKLDKLDGFTATFSKRKNPPAVQVDDETQIPAEYMRTPEPPPPPAAVPDKAKIAAAIKAKTEVAGCRLTQGERLVRS